MAAKVVVILGPTGSGKSALALRVAQDFDGEIIAADSRTVYKGMDIGTAKPTRAEQEQVPHHLLDVVEPGLAFTAAEFKQRAAEAVADIQSRGRLPLVVGGTGLYVDSLVFDYQFPAPHQPALRVELEELAISELEARLEGIDPGLVIQAAGNKRRLVRYLEIGGQEGSRRASPLPGYHLIGLNPPRGELVARIGHRVEQMVSDGFEEEVRAIGERYGWESEALTGIGYRAFKAYAQGSASLDEAKQAFVQGDIALAKKQLTWFKRNTYIKWFADAGGAYAAIKQLLRAE